MAENNSVACELRGSLVDSFSFGSIERQVSGGNKSSEKYSERKKP